MKTLRIPTFIVFLVTLFFSCQKELSIEGVTTAAGTWQFNGDTKLYTGNIDSAYIEISGTTKTLNLIGKSIDGQQNFLLHLYATDSFSVGTYKASLFQSDFQYYSQSKTIYEADQFIGEFIVTITTLTNNTITGIFSGASEDSTKNIKPITLGKFTSRIILGNGSVGIPPPATDYFPTTPGSFWRYGNINADPKDSFLITATSRTKVVGSVTYNVFTYEAISSSGRPEELYYRKSSGNYYEYFDPENFFGFNAGTTIPKNIEYFFLKESANVNDTFSSPRVTGITAINNSPTAVTVYIRTTIIAKATSALSGSVNSNDVMKVKYEYIGSWTGMPPFVFTIEERWFAKGIGLIYNSFDDRTTKDNYHIGQYKVF